ncbi:MAG: DUF3188 domain-containing protein [Synechococcus sp. SB0662_bin_45]|uniref:DUF3188 domain-containing protein n=1 Tax=Synechococcus sp. SB0676_bin_10 TaxID=2604869 RepID=A0A6B1FBN9_9SYNE|nr:DUF3188 domain-containing protein [Synechococcus sp. SB0668_bin_13]MXX09627.1 DUF3188 domain-containing protein [Synechococcus sp. SB0667_bin_8]MXY63382.1 DUF3188 domain-containing protein [Synechococcus sp. SB0665_bin_28]MYE21506.1 DUF3188 domain-containing protein [Synechococcus sp. SB0662_bin_45]MYF21128.1 DUF3188 domain-containing protein [Synechococcus sp. SB0677_bin_5]MYF36994.1 DUF3188 domain-containing protein [Synechococcus sp. SB0678_bin_12]MYG39145.1 DUF3188 domain-containing pr
MNTPPHPFSRLVAMAGPAMVCLGLLASLQRANSEKLQTVPMVVIGAGLTVTACGQWIYHRRRILRALRKTPRNAAAHGARPRP